MGNDRVSKYRGDHARVVGRRIGQIRDSLGFTLEEFGRLVEPVASKSNVSKWEKGMSKPSRKRSKQIAELGNISVDELLGTNSTKTVEEITHEIKSTYNPEEIKEIIRNLI